MNHPDYSTIAIHRQTKRWIEALALESKPVGTILTYEVMLNSLLMELHSLRQKDLDNETMIYLLKEIKKDLETYNKAITEAKLGRYGRNR